MTPDVLPSTASVVAPVTFVVTPQERIAAVATIDRNAGVGPRLLSVNGILYLVFGAFQLGIGMIGTVHGRHPSSSSSYLLLGSLWLALGIVTLAFSANINRVRARLWYRSRETTFAADDGGLTIADPRARDVPWASVRRVEDLGEIFAIHTSRRRTLVPKRTLEDRGVRFWALATDRLVGRRLLVGSPPRTVIFNTADRRR